MTTQGPRWRALAAWPARRAGSPRRSPWCCGSETTRAARGPRARRGARAPAATRRPFRPRTKTTSATWTAACRSRPRRSRGGTRGPSGPPATIASGTASASTAYGALDFLKTLSTHPSLKTSRDHRWEYLGLVNEPCFVKPTGPDPKRHGLWLDQRSPDCPPDPFENEQKYPGVADRRARQDDRARLATTGMPPASSGCGCFPNPDFDERGREGVGRESLLHRSRVLQLEHAGAVAPRRHVVRLLPRRSEPDEAARRSGEPEVGEPQLQRRGAVLLGRPDLRLERGSARPSSSSCFTPRARVARHLADLDRQHQQPADDERGLPAAAAAAAGEAVGQGNARRRRPRQPAVQRLRERGTADAVLRGAGHGLDAARAQGRLPIRSARSARSTACSSTSGRSAKSGCCTSTRWSAAGACRRSRSPTRGRTPRTSRPPRRRRSTSPASFSRPPARII